MTNKEGFSTIGGTATLMDDETQTLSPADRVYPPMSKDDIVKIIKDQTEILHKTADKQSDEAEVLAQGENQKAYQAKLREASRTRRLAETMEEVKVTMHENSCTLRINMIKKAFNLCVPKKDCVNALSMLVTDYTTEVNMASAQRNRKSGQKFDYSGRGEIITADKDGEAA